MRKLLTRPRRGLIVAAALAVTAVLSTGTTTALAATTTASSAPCSLGPTESCQSTNPTIAINIDYINATKCIFGWQVSWGDSTLTNVTVADPANGYALLAKHTYASSGTYAISATAKAITANCTTTPFKGTFTVRVAAPTPGVAEACVFNAPSGGFTIPGVDGKHIYISGHVGWAYLANPAKGMWEYGANEGPVSGITGRSRTWMRSGSWADVLATFKNALGAGKSKTYYHTANYYKSYRCATVLSYHTAAALKVAKAQQGETYIIPGSDCLAQTTDVLAKYGAPINDSSYLLHPNDWVPNSYYESTYMSKFGPQERI